MDYFEKDLEIPFMKVLSENPSGLPMSSIKTTLLQRLNPTGTSAQRSKKRKGEIMLHQRIGNFTKFRRRRIFTNGLVTYSYRTKKYKLTKKGQLFLQNNNGTYMSLISQGFSPKQREDEMDNDYKNLVIEEGNVTETTRKQRARSTKLRILKIRQLKQSGNPIACCACGFNFEDLYDGVGKDFIVIHHTEPIHLVDGTGRKQSVDEALKKVVPVCSNCHSIIHKKDPMLTIDQLKSIIANQRGR
ncbi:MAG: hypothetical protein KA120_00615 [Candidatus Goldbacteria bacterium]|nr:hypothetical protein [Candidatus Goldiibacteriota bacterium]